MRSVAVFVMCALAVTGSRHGPADSFDGSLRSLVLGALTARRMDDANAPADPDGPMTIDWLAGRLLSAIKADRSALAHMHARESLLSIAPNGTLLDEADGNGNEVALPPSFDAPLQRPDAAIVLVHNHPRGNGLSGADLGQLAKPGVAGIIAVGHDSSLYAAAAGPAYHPNVFETDTYPLAMRETLRRLRTETAGTHVEAGAVEAQVEHVVAQSLNKARVIRYRAELGASRSDSYRRLQVVFGHVSAGVAVAVTRAPSSRIRPPGSPPAVWD